MTRSDFLNPIKVVRNFRQASKELATRKATIPDWKEASSNWNKTYLILTFWIIIVITLPLAILLTRLMDTLNK